MNRRFEKGLSQFLSLFVLIVFISTIISTNMNIPAVNYIWTLSFLIAWVLMLVFAVYILFQKDSYGLSIFTAIITAIAFGVLSVPASLVLSRFIPGLVFYLSFNNQFFNLNTQLAQLILYTVLIVVYFIHLLNAHKLKNKNDQYIAASQNTDQSSLINNDKEEIDEDGETINKNNKEEIVFESDIDQEVEYNTEKVELVEELTDEDLENMKGEDNNG
ncbi:hypothetical protein [uncultured Anaerococcus sp.]|uniref:hypothetical protein n=1 Tax=uncultured Anaerococcus sp. TaxID=293428 RepID=UPI0026072003|nr:hypothetical protein [uncultured Anaerococcus sp.]